MNVLIADSVADVGVEILRQWAHVDIQLALTPEQLRSNIKGYEALIVRSQTKVTSDVIDAADNLLVIARAGVGVDNIDVDAATRRGILVVNVVDEKLINQAIKASADYPSSVDEIKEVGLTAISSDRVKSQLQFKCR